MKPLLVCALALFILSPLSAQTRDVEPTRPMLGVEGGRYVLGQIGTGRKDQYLLDTKTGRVWHFVETKDGALILEWVPIVQSNGVAANCPEPEEDAEAARKCFVEQGVKEAAERAAPKTK